MAEEKKRIPEEDRRCDKCDVTPAPHWLESYVVLTDLNMYQIYANFCDSCFEEVSKFSNQRSIIMAQPGTPFLTSNLTMHDNFYKRVVKDGLEDPYGTKKCKNAGEINYL
jgi:hypothetical protein